MRWLSTMTAVLVIGCSGRATGEAQSTVEADGALIDAIRAAVRRETDPDSISRLINMRATMNTSRIRDRAAVAAASYVRDRDRPNEGPPPERWLRAVNVVYWVRQGDYTGQNPRIVGVAWFPNQPPEMFFAEVLPP